MIRINIVEIAQRLHKRQVSNFDLISIVIIRAESLNLGSFKPS